ncbi:MAG: porin family protein [Rhizobiales bacterium]|jgi:outer membrane immunogenic protein|nr:porin family protein [Hyphomicrobiales bacterium]
MRKTVLAVFAALALACVPAAAADLTSYTTPTRASFWQGPYVGANLGYQWGSITNAPHDPSGVVGGLQAGYNWQNGQFVFGGETDLQISDADDRFARWQFANPWFGTLRARAGIALNNVLFYGTAGLAYGTLKLEDALTGASESATKLGWAAGVGLEVGLTQNWSARAEYLYVDLGDHSFAFIGSRHGMDSGTLRLGVNYRF